MSHDRRQFLTIAGASAAIAAFAAAPALAQTPESARARGVKALVFDAFGTLLDVLSVTPLCEQLFPGKGTQLAQLWRERQLQYSYLRTIMGRHRDFWGLTEDGLVFAANKLKLDLTTDKKKQLLDDYLKLAIYPDAKPGLDALKKQGLKLAILSNGEPKMLAANIKNAGIGELLDDVISIEEIKVFKPSPRVYNLAAERMNVRNSELGLVSSNNWDIVGAASAGLRTFWIHRNPEDVPEVLGWQAEFVVNAFTDLPQLFRG
jgi:2-haloacid dehalogenase